MEYIITNTTDHKYEGLLIKYSSEKFIVLNENIVNIEKILKINEKEIRLINSNYCIDLKEV